MKLALLRVVDATLAADQGDRSRTRRSRTCSLGEPPRPSPARTRAPITTDGTDVAAVAREVGRAAGARRPPIQGPPGTGKTYTAARMVTALVRAGKRVGITAQSHRTISNLVDEVLRAADTDPQPTDLRIVQRAGELDPWVRDPRVKLATDPKGCFAAFSDGANVVAGTSWLFARPDWISASTSCSSTKQVSTRSRTSWLQGRPQSRSCSWATRTNSRW